MRVHVQRKAISWLFLGLLLLACKLSSSATTPTLTTTPIVFLRLTQTPTHTPAMTVTMTLTPTPSPQLSAEIYTDGRRANLYAQRDESSEVLAALRVGSPLTITGRTQDYTWLAVRSAEDVEGWLLARVVSSGGCLDGLAVVDAESSYQPPASIDLDMQAYPYFSGLCARSREIFAQGQALGNRAEVFSKIGDSITVSEYFMTPLGLGQYQLDQYGHLQDVIDFYSSETARTANSFANTSISAFGGWPSWTVLNPNVTNPNLCEAGETPLECELRLVKPAVALIMLGTNDAADPNLITPSFYEENMRRIIEICIARGVIPVVSTIPELLLPDFQDRATLFNGTIAQLADEYDVPLWDYHAALVELVNQGLFSDGVHPTVGPNGAGDFSPFGLQSGMNMRNLTGLQALDALWRGVITN